MILSLGNTSREKIVTVPIFDTKSYVIIQSKTTINLYKLQTRRNTNGPPADF